MTDTKYLLVVRIDEGGFGGESHAFIFEVETDLSDLSARFKELYDGMWGQSPDEAIMLECPMLTGPITRVGGNTFRLESFPDNRFVNTYFPLRNEFTLSNNARFDKIWVLTPDEDCIKILDEDVVFMQAYTELPGSVDPFENIDRKPDLTIKTGFGPEHAQELEVYYFTQPLDLTASVPDQKTDMTAVVPCGEAFNAEPWVIYGKWSEAAILDQYLTWCKAP